MPSWLSRTGLSARALTSIRTGASCAERAWFVGEFGVATVNANGVDNEAGLDASVWQHVSVFQSELALSVKDETLWPSKAAERAPSERRQAAATAQGLL